MFWVGDVQPRKNVQVLVDAFARAVADTGVPHAFVLVGPRGWLDDRDAGDAGLGDRLVVPGSVGRADLSALYAGADLLAFPSLHEGFGLPVLEAMAQGTAVLVSDIPALHEVGGDAARFVSPTDGDAWRDALIELLTDPTAQRRAARRAARRRPRSSRGTGARRAPSPSTTTPLPSDTRDGVSDANSGAQRVRTSTPESVTSTVCSNCAVRDPSAVTAVQPSSQISGSMLPIVIIGSMVNVIPGSSTVLAAGS